MPAVLLPLLRVLGRVGFPCVSILPGPLTLIRESGTVNQPRRSTLAYKPFCQSLHQFFIALPSHYWIGDPEFKRGPCDAGMRQE